MSRYIIVGMVDCTYLYLL